MSRRDVRRHHQTLDTTITHHFPLKVRRPVSSSLPRGFVNCGEHRTEDCTIEIYPEEYGLKSSSWPSCLFEVLPSSPRFLVMVSRKKSRDRRGKTPKCLLFQEGTTPFVVRYVDAPVVLLYAKDMVTSALQNIFTL